MSMSIRLLVTGLSSVLVCAGLVSVSPAVQASVRAVPNTIAGDCSVDVSADLQYWLRSLPSGSTAKLRKEGCYRVEREILVSNKNHFTLDGRGALLKRTEFTPPELRYPKANGFLRFVNLADSVIKNVRIQGTNTVPEFPWASPEIGTYKTEVEFDAGIALHGALRTRVENVDVRSVWGDGVYVSGADHLTGYKSKDVVLDHVFVKQNGRQGITINRSTHVLVDHATIVFSRRSGIDLEPDAAKETMSTIEIQNSSVSALFGAISAYGAGRVNSVKIHNNRVPYSGVPWLYVRSSSGLDRHDWSVTDNTVMNLLGSPMPGIAFWNTRGITITGNRMRFATTQSREAVGLWDGSTAAIIRCNGLQGVKTDFVSMTQSEQVVVDIGANALDSMTPPCKTDKSAAQAISRAVRGPRS